MISKIHCISALTSQLVGKKVYQHTGPSLVSFRGPSVGVEARSSGCGLGVRLDQVGVAWE